ncbi:helix-turn-helix domain-containing protein [Vreelandella sulfidaeris]|uniref:helix-turn-helix domain-containing protein n=1 Tax=Vreelandella sulfidaeris TaxID=115553 RepID=UPI0035EFB0E5
MFQRAITLRDDNLESPLSIRSLANELGITWRRLNRLFARHLAISPQQAYLARRLDHACWLLSKTPHSIMNISLACGFTPKLTLASLESLPTRGRRWSRSQSLSTTFMSSALST